MTICDAALQEYAEMLHSNGFDIYEPGPTWEFFRYSRTVDGRTLFGSVQKDGIGSGTGKGYSHSMPIKPSRENGSSMFVPEADEVDPLSLAAALLITRPTNSNDLVGVQNNFEPTEFELASSTKW